MDQEENEIMEVELELLPISKMKLLQEEQKTRLEKKGKSVILK